MLRPNSQTWMFQGYRYNLIFGSNGGWLFWDQLGYELSIRFSCYCKIYLVSILSWLDYHYVGSIVCMSLFKGLISNGDWRHE